MKSPTVEIGDRGRRRPMRWMLDRQFPQTPRNLFGATDDEVLIFLEVAHHDAQDLEHRVREVGTIPENLESNSGIYFGWKATSR